MTHEMTKLVAEVSKLATEVSRVMTKYNITEESMEEIIKVHNGDVKAALRTIKSFYRTFNK